MRCLFSHPELLKGTRLSQVGSWIAPSVVRTDSGSNSLKKYLMLDLVKPWGIFPSQFSRLSFRAAWQRFKREFVWSTLCSWSSTQPRSAREF